MFDPNALSFTRESLIEALEAARRKTCCYSDGKKDARPCDCKYGATTPISPSSEQTGCPELRIMVGLLKSLSDREYEILAVRANKLF